MAERKVKLLCGAGTVDLSLSESVPDLEMKRFNALTDPEEALYKALDDPINSQSECSCNSGWYKCNL